MDQNDFYKVVHDMTLETGVGWTLPIILDITGSAAQQLEPNERLGLETPAGEPVGYLVVDDIYRYNVDETAAALFGTTDRDHPGVQQLVARDPFLVGGDIYVFNDVSAPVGKKCLTPSETRVLFDHLNWETVVGFQTRNAPHRGHEYIQKSALERVDGIFIHPKLGKKKIGDYTDEAILAGYDALVEEYYPEETVVTSPFPSRMLYAGPREAVFDAIVRKNHGCTHFIIGRDHAGVGDYYDDFAAQRLFSDLPGLDIDPMFFYYAFYCERCGEMASEKTCPHEDARVEPSGTLIRDTLRNGDIPSAKLMRSEVAKRINGMNGIFVQ
jgi:sulfate adenylyltransferase